MMEFTTESTGNGNLILVESPGSNLQTGDIFTADISVADDAIVQWEFSNCTYITAGEFSRDVVIASSENDGYVTFTSGIKDVSIELPPEKNIRNSTNVNMTNSAISVANVNANVATANAVVSVGANVTTNTTVVSVGANVVLNATAVLIGNSTAYANIISGIVKLANSTVNTTLTIPTAAQYNGSYFLHANGTWTTLSGAAGSAGGSNTYVQFNDSTSIAGSIGFTFDKATNNAVIANTLNVSTLFAGANVVVNTTSIFVGNSTANLFANSILAKVANSTATANLVPNSLTIGTSVVNSTVISTAAGLFINTTAIKVPNNALITASATAANGYTYLTGGILMQWGWVAANATVGDITFPVAFPTAVYSYQSTSNSTVAANAAAAIIAANQTTMNVRSTSTAAASNSYWLAIGG